MYIKYGLSLCIKRIRNFKVILNNIFPNDIWIEYIAVKIIYIIYNLFSLLDILTIKLTSIHVNKLQNVKVKLLKIFWFLFSMKLISINTRPKQRFLKIE